MKRSLFFMLLVGSILAVACNLSSPSPEPTISVPPTTVVTEMSVPTSPPAPTATTAPPPTIAPTAPPTQAPTAIPTTGPLPTGFPSTYIDDRSSAASLVQSFVSALNLHEYLRAYSYWEPNAVGLKPFAEFEAGYAETQSVQLTLGNITSDAGAGQLYSSVPVTLIAYTTSNVKQTFVGCIILHISQPGIQGVPPFQPLGINSADIQEVDNNTDTTGLMAQACENPGLPVELTPPPDPNDITANRYLDDRSDAVQVLRSLFNAINRHEYVRAYSYWEPDAQGLAPYDQFETGYANTASVQLTVGAVVEDAGAGQRYYQVPVTLVVLTTGGITQTFVGCYILHISVPEIQGMPPFQPLGVMSATVQQADNNADTATLMEQACQ